MPKAKTDATDSTQTSFHTADTTTGQMTFAIIQTNFWVGDIAGNVKKMHALTLDAKARGADIVIFPELALVGYPPEDLLLRPIRPPSYKMVAKKAFIISNAYQTTASLMNSDISKKVLIKSCLIIKA